MQTPEYYAEIAEMDLRSAETDYTPGDAMSILRSNAYMGIARGRSGARSRRKRTAGMTLCRPPAR